MPNVGILSLQEVEITVIYRYVNGTPVTQEELRALTARGTLFSGHVATARRRRARAADAREIPAKAENIADCKKKDNMVS